MPKSELNYRQLRAVEDITLHAQTFAQAIRRNIGGTDAAKAAVAAINKVAADACAAVTASVE